LHVTLRQPLKEYLPRDKSYNACFDRFEYFLAMVHLDLNLQRDSDYDPKKADWAPLGRFAMRGRRSAEGGILEEVSLEFEQQLGEWPPFTSGLFECSVEEYKVLELNLRNFISRMPTIW
jgi:hypothetical protein